MELRVLGPIELWSAGQQCDLGPTRARCVLAILMLTPRTVAFHKYKLMERLGLQTNADLVQYAIQEHILTPRS